MEKEILREMVIDRSKEIKHLRRKIQFQEERIDVMTEELNQLRLTVSQQRFDNENEIEMLVEARFVVEEILAKLGADLQQQGPSLHRYAEHLKKQAGPKMADSSYVIKMQAQLCKSMHTNGITNHYVELVRSICEAEIKYLEDARKQVVERMSNQELELLNLVVAKDQEYRAFQATQNSRLESQRLHIEKIREMLNECKEDKKEETEERHLYLVAGDEPFLPKKLLSSQRNFLDPVREEEGVQFNGH